MEFLLNLKIPRKDGDMQGFLKTMLYDQFIRN
jgi:hypothetical protein